MLFITVCLFYSSSSSFKHLLSWFMPAFCFWNFGSSLLSLLWIFFQVDYLFPFYSFDFAGFCLAAFVCNIFLSSHFCWWMQLCSCLAGSLTWGLQHWSLLAVGWSRVLVLRWGLLRELTSINISWSLNFSGSPAVWTHHSHCSSSAQPLAWHWRPKRDAAKKTKENETKTGKQNQRQIIRTKPNIKTKKRLQTDK